MKKILKILLWSIPVTPLIVPSNIFYSHIVGQTFFLRIILSLISLLFISYFFYKKSFRNEISEKVSKLIKNPLVISVCAFLFIIIISTIFAVDKYVAFWGNLARGEGLVGIMYFFSFFVFSLLILEKKDWLWFFRLSLFTTLILLIKEFWQFFSGVVRPGSFLDNPSFLAGYLLFSIFCSIIVSSDVKNKFFKYFSIIIFILSIVGIFITETRGTILGLFLGIISVLIFYVIKGKNISFGKLNLRKLSVFVISFLVIFSIFFIVTKQNKIWQKIPGFSRVAVIGQDDTTTNTRLLLQKLSIKSVDPFQNSWKKFLIGWGPENFILAYEKYFQATQFNYEMNWFDRAHNKFLDVLVMNGILGLISYLAIWFFFFRSIFRKKDFSFINGAFVLIGVSFLVHLLFVFDQPITFINFFSVISFFVFISIKNDCDKNIYEKK